MMIRRVMLVVAILVVSVNVSHAQNQNKTDNVTLFQTFFQDVPIAAQPYGEGFFQYSTFERDVSSIDLAAQAAFPVSPQVQLGGGLGFRSISPDVGDSQSGITDLLVTGRYNVMPGPTAISVGALATLPIGSEDVLEGTFDFSGFGSIRHNLPSDLVITGTLALEFIETKIGNTSDRDNGLLLASGIIYPTQNNLSIVGELNIRTKGDYVLLSGGLDYALQNSGKIRGGIGIGLDDGAPNFTLRVGYFRGL